MILATLRRGRFTGQTSQTILRLCPSPIRPACAAPLPTTAEILTVPVLVRSPAPCPGSCRCHRPTVIQEPCHAWQSTHVAWRLCWRFRDLQVTTVRPASLNASRNPGGELIKPESLPKFPSWGVSSSSSVQQPSSLCLLLRSRVALCSCPSKQS